jgi:hypothetical protein
MFTRSILGLCLVVCLSARAATLEQMSIEDLTLESTSIVRGYAAGSRAARVGSIIYTFTTFRLAESLKGEPTRKVEIALPGGQVGDVSQRFGGVPRLEAGEEYLVFLWRGPSGLTQITGLSQGLIQIENTPERFAIREPSPDLVIAPETGKAAKNERLRMPIGGLVARIRAALATGGPTVP